MRKKRLQNKRTEVNKTYVLRRLESSPAEVQIEDDRERTSVLTTVETNLLKDLATHQDRICISIYIPTHVKGPEIEQDPIRLKNAISSADTELESAGVDEEMRNTLLLRPRERVEDRSFWRHQGSGLALFISDGFYEEVRLRAPVTERVRVDDRFMITPLVEATGEHSIHLLALSRGNARLFQIGEQGGTSLELPEGTPVSMEQANWFLDREAQLQDRAKTTGGEFHGHSDDGTERADLRRFLRELSEGVKAVVSDSTVVVAAVSELAAAYQHDARHHVSDHVVAGNPDDMDLNELRERAASVIEATRAEKMEALEHRWREALGTDAATKGIIDTVIAAHHGRVETLLVGDTTPIWGTFDPDEVEVVVYDERGDDHRNLVDDSIRATLLNGGRVVSVRQIDENIGALLRY